MTACLTEISNSMVHTMEMLDYTNQHVDIFMHYRLVKDSKSDNSIQAMPALVFIP